MKRKLFSKQTSFALVICMVLTMVPLTAVPAFAAPGDYHTGDIAVINAIIDDNGLAWTKAEPDGSECPANWTGVTWSDDVSGKRVTKLDLLDRSLTGALDVSGLTAMDWLDCCANKLTSINVSGLINLQYLNCSTNDLTSINLSGLTNLQYLDLMHNDLESLNVSDLVSLVELNCGYNLLESLDVSDLVNLEGLFCMSNELESLDVSDLANLKELYCYSNSLESLFVSGCASLEYLGCYHNALKSLDVSGLEKLRTLNCSYNDLTSIVLDDKAPYERVYLDFNYMADKSAVTGRTIDWDDNDNDTYSFDPQRKFSYTITFMNGEEIHATKSVALPDYTVDEQPVTPVNGSNIFVGWFTEPNGQGKQFVDRLLYYEVLYDMTVYAHWIDTFIPVESMVVTGIPASNSIIIGQPYPLSVDADPANATYQSDYKWETSNYSVATVDSGGNLVFHKDGRVTITLTSDETVYRQNHGLAPNDAVLVKTFTFDVGDVEARLVTNSVSASMANDGTSVTAWFTDNFGVQEGAWDSAVFEYTINDSDGVPTAKAGPVTRGYGGSTRITITFDGVTPKIASRLSNGEFLPAYNITMTATADGRLVSATAPVFIMPPPAALECLTEKTTAISGQEAVFEFKATNLMPGYTANYEILLAGEEKKGALAESNKVTDPATGLTSMIGRVVYTPWTQDANPTQLIRVSVQNPGDRSQEFSQYIMVINPDQALISLQLRDGFDGGTINPEPGDMPGVFYGLSESKLAQLIGDDASSQQAAFAYLNRMARTKTLNLSAPWAWGQMQAAGGGQIKYFSAMAGDALQFSASDVGKPITLSWKNVPTTMQFTYREDNLTGKVFAFELKDAHTVPVNLNYTNGSGQTIKKAVTPYNGIILLYEPSGISGQVWITQNGGANNFRYASVTPWTGTFLNNNSVSWGSSELGDLVVVTPYIAYTHEYGLPFNSTYVPLYENPVAKFAPLKAHGHYLTAVNYGVVDGNGKYIEGTSGRTTAIINGEFKLPLADLFANPGARLGVEFSYVGFDNLLTSRIIYYDLQTLYDNLTHMKTNSYDLQENTIKQSAFITGDLGVRNLMGLLSGTTTGILRSDILETEVVVGPDVASVSLRLSNYSLENSSIVPGKIVIIPAYEVIKRDYGFTNNNYSLLRFKPGLAEYFETPGQYADIVMLVRFKNGTETMRPLGSLRLEDNGETVKNIQQILRAVQGQDFFHPNQMQMHIGDVDVQGNVRALQGRDEAVFDYDVARVFDKVQADFAIPSRNPFTFDVKRKGDEYIVRGYVYAKIMNQAGWVKIADRWFGEDLFDEKFEYAKAKAHDSLAHGSFPGSIGYIEGKAVVTAGGVVNVSFTGGRIFTQSRLEYFPNDEFDMYGFWKWKIGFEGDVISTFEIKAPDDGAYSASPVKFNMTEVSSIQINIKTGHNGMNLDAGLYAQKVKLAGAISAYWSQRSIYRPYSTTDRKLQRSVALSTGGDLRSTYYMRLVGIGSYDEESKFSPKWYTYFSRSPWDGKPYIKNYQFSKEFSSNSDSLLSMNAAAPLAVLTVPGQEASGYTAAPLAVAAPLAPIMVRTQEASGYTAAPLAVAATLAMPAQVAFGRGAEHTDAPSFSASILNADWSPLGTGSDVLTSARYYNNGGGKVYQDTDGAIVTSDTDGANHTTVDASGFGLDSADAGNRTIAAWVTLNSAFDSGALDNFDADVSVAYAASMGEIKVGVRDGGSWSNSILTNNAMADISPKTATNGSEAIVIWAQGIPDVSVDEGEMTFGLDESRLMFARYDGSSWGAPAALYTLPGSGIAEYVAAMDQDGDTLVTIVTDSGSIVLVLVSTDGKATVIGNNLPAATRISLLYNGETYMLACFDAENILLSLVELNTGGFITDTTFTGIPTNTGGEFQLLRDWSKTGIEAAVLLWPGTVVNVAEDTDYTGTPGNEDGNPAETVIYASRMTRAEGGSRVSVSAPLKAVSSRDEVFVESYDASINGGSIKVLTTFGTADGGRYLDETTAIFTNTIKTIAGVKDISSLAPGNQADFSVRINNRGFSVINNIAVHISGGERVSMAVNLLPNEEVILMAPLMLTQSLPDSIPYSVTAVFAGGETAVESGSIPLLKTDVAAEILYTEKKDGVLNLEALISNSTAYSLDGKTVVAGIYTDPFGTMPVSEATMNGADFTREGLGVSVPAELTLSDADDLPDLLYLVAKVYDSGSKALVYDSDGSNNVRIIMMPLVGLKENPSTPGDDGGTTPTNPSTPDGGGGGITPTNPLDAKPDTIDNKVTTPADRPPATDNGGNTTANPFTDINSSDWFYDSVIFVYTHGLMVGTSTESMIFSPNTPATRGMIVTILYRLAGSPDVSGLNNPFNDVAEDTWYTDAVKWAAANGIVNGYGDGIFGPEDNITREQLVTILNDYTRFTGLTLPETREYAGFADDADIAGYAKEAIVYFYKAGIVNGKPGPAKPEPQAMQGSGQAGEVAEQLPMRTDGSLFDPKGNATRAEVAAMLMRLIEAARIEL